jgi:hypothetical protein
MRRSAILIPVILVLALALTARGATVNFTATLAGANERPDPADSPATGSASGTLTGEDGSWVFTYHVEYADLTGPATVGHIHDAINPGGLAFVDQFGPPVHDLDALTSPIDGDWRFDDAGQPLTDASAAALLAGRMYVNIHSELFPNGEIRGQFVPVDAPPPPPPGAIPLPAPVYAGMLGLFFAGRNVWKQRRAAAAAA